MTYPGAGFQGLDCPCDGADPAVHVLGAVRLQTTAARSQPLCLCEPPSPTAPGTTAPSPAAAGSCLLRSDRTALPSPAKSVEGGQRGRPHLQHAARADTAPHGRDAHRIAACSCLCFFLLAQGAAVINKPRRRSETARSPPRCPCPEARQPCASSSADVCWLRLPGNILVRGGWLALAVSTGIYCLAK